MHVIPEGKENGIGQSSYKSWKIYLFCRYFFLACWTLWWIGGCQGGGREWMAGNRGSKHWQSYEWRLKHGDKSYQKLPPAVLFLWIDQRLREKAASPKLTRCVNLLERWRVTTEQNAKTLKTSVFLASPCFTYGSVKTHEYWQSFWARL